MLTLATVITIGTTPLSAQRRSTGTTNTATREQGSSTQTRNQTQTQNRNQTQTQSNTNTQRRETATPQTNRNQTQTQTQTQTQPQNNANRRNSSTSVSTNNNNNNNNNNNRNVNTPDARRTTENARTTYRLDENDSRYRPNSNFSGNNQYWSFNNRPGNMNYNRNDRNFYRNYNFHTYSHWNRQWETYYWNVYSWRDYYRAYHTQSYLFHRNYVFNTRYGHVIKRFNNSSRPIIFYHRNIAYYCYNGHFFRHVRGVGYVLVDIPFGITFSTLPYEYERVYINGYLYFRIGNLFFERTPMGFSLIHYPERYYAFEIGFRNGGYFFGDDIYW